MSDRPLAVEVRGLRKTFRVPRYRVSTLKERALHPFRRSDFDHIRALEDIDFEVPAGEFFGIVGRNGSGKSTLLKCLAGIYKPDSGRIRVAGRLSPFIELGVGFNPELTARDNVLINGVMMGLSPRDTRARLDDIIAFAEVERFADQKLKNFSSGMQVRLAFSAMIQSDPDVMLIDEVLAVGDAAFQQKCLDVFYDIRQAGKTVVLVTHEMGLVERFCHRAMLIADSHIKQIGEPIEIAREYLRENFRTYQSEGFAYAAPDEVRLIDAWISDADGARLDAIHFGDEVALNIVIEAREQITAPGVAMWLSNKDGERIFSVGARENDEALSDLEPGERLTFSVQLTNNLNSGHYYLGCSVTRGTAGLDVLLFQQRASDVVCYGAHLDGVFAIEHVSHVSRSREGQPVG